MNGITLGQALARLDPLDLLSVTGREWYSPHAVSKGLPMEWHSYPATLERDSLSYELPNRRGETWTIRRAPAPYHIRPTSGR